MPKIIEMLLNVEGFKYDTSLDINMGYNHIHHIEKASKMCTVILPLDKYRYKCIPMGLSNYPDIFQETMNKMFSGFDFIIVYIDDLLIITKGDWFDHLEKMELTLQMHKYNGLQCNI